MAINYLAEGYINRRDHPYLPLQIYNYTRKAQYEPLWDRATIHARGLVLCGKEVVINPPKKFFNQGELFAPKINLRRAIITEKLDGFYIAVCKSTKFGLIVTSRGSFDNKYVDAAKKFITPAIQENLIPNLTYFCELCQDFPGDESLIVTRHPNPMLICWAIRDVNGNEFSPAKLSPFPYAQTFTFKEAKNYLKGKVEGVVAYDPQTGDRVKIKTSWYLEMHKLISGCTKRNVWKVLARGGDTDGFISNFPDELYGQADKWKNELITSFNKLLEKIEDAYDATENLSDKEVAQKVKKDLAWGVFLIRKDRYQELYQKIWQRIEPVGE